MSSSVRLSSVCLSVTFVRPTQAIEIFGTFSSPFGTLAICWHLGKILRRSSQGNPSVGGLNTTGVAEYSDFGPIERISQKRYKIGAKFVLITNRKSHMSFRLVPNSVTLDGLERRNSPYRRVISSNSVAFGTDYVKVVEDTPILFERKCRPKNLVFSDI